MLFLRRSLQSFASVCFSYLLVTIQPSTMISSPQFKNTASVHGHHYCVPKGLKNLGNSCYMNAVMQALAVSDNLYQSVRSSNHSSHCQLTDCVLCSLERCISDLRRPIPLTRNFHPMMRLVRLLPRLSLDGAVMTSGRQEDAHEFLSHLITAAVNDGSAVDGKKDCESSPREDRKLFSRDAGYLHALFDGSLCSSVRCRQCGTVSQTVEAIQGLELEVAHAATLQAALEGFCRTEELDKNTDNAYDCSVCKEHTAAQKTLRLQKTPKLLQIQMKRFVISEAGSRSSGCQKLSHLVDFPEHLDLTPYMLELEKTTNDDHHEDQSGDVKKEVPPVYRLAAAVVHLGQGLHSGHYTAYVHPRSSTGQHAACPWYFVSDDTVRRVPLSEVLAQPAYMLFYEQVLPEESNTEISSLEAVSRQFTSPKRVEKRALSVQTMPTGGSLSDRLNRSHGLPSSLPAHQDYSYAANGERSTAYQRHYELQQSDSTLKDSRFGSNPLFSPPAASSRPVTNKIPAVQYHVEVQQRAARTFSFNSTSSSEVASGANRNAGATASAAAGTPNDSNKRPRHSYFALPSFSLSKKRLFNSVNLFSGSKRRRDVGELGHHHVSTPAATSQTNGTAQCASDGLSTFFTQQHFEATPHKDMPREGREREMDGDTDGEDSKRRRVADTSTPPSASTSTPTTGAPVAPPRDINVSRSNTANAQRTQQHISVDVLRENRKKAGGSWLSFLPNKIKTLFA